MYRYWLHVVMSWFVAGCSSMWLYCSPVSAQPSGMMAPLDPHFRQVALANLPRGTITFDLVAPDYGQKIPEFIVPGLRANTGFMGLATHMAGPAGPINVIYYDQAFWNSMQQKSMVLHFLRMHEYMHHRFGHSGAFAMAAGNPFAMSHVSAQTELQADYEATRILMSQGLAMTVDVHADYIRTILPPCDLGRPGWIQRYRVMINAGAHQLINRLPQAAPC